MSATCRRHVADMEKCRLFLSRQGKIGDMFSCVSAHFCVAISRHVRTKDRQHMYVDKYIHYRIPMWTPLSHNHPRVHRRAFSHGTSQDAHNNTCELQSTQKGQHHCGILFNKQSPPRVRAFEAPTTESPSHARTCVCVRGCRNHLVLKEWLDVIKSTLQGIKSTKPQAPSTNQGLLRVNSTQQVLPFPN